MSPTPSERPKSKPWHHSKSNSSSSSISSVGVGVGDGSGSVRSYFSPLNSSDSRAPER